MNFLAKDSPVSGGGDSQTMTRVLVANNLAEYVEGFTFQVLGGPVDLRIRHNTTMERDNAGTAPLSWRCLVEARLREQPRGPGTILHLRRQRRGRRRRDRHLCARHETARQCLVRPVADERRSGSVPYQESSGEFLSCEPERRGIRRPRERGLPPRDLLSLQGQSYSGGASG